MVGRRGRGRQAHRADGDIPKGWKQGFETTVRLLGGGEWGEIQVKRDKVRVGDVEPGSEDELRHHIEAVVAQANADHEPDDGDEDDGAPDTDEPGAGAGAGGERPDAEMTRRFRSF